MTLLWALTACTSGGPEIRSLEPVLEVAPAAVEFGRTGTLAPGRRDLIVANRGFADLVLTPTLEDPAGVFVVDTPDPWVVDPGEEQRIDVTFAPDTLRRYTAQLRLDSNDEGRRVVWVPLRGEGADLPYPDIVIGPARTIEWAGPGIEAIEVRNVGEEPLIIDELTFADPGAPFALASDPLAGADTWPIAPGQASTVLVTYAPTDPTGAFTDLRLSSNDPDEPVVAVRLVGDGGGDFERPVAVIDCPASFGLAGPRTLTLDGSTSFDPLGAAPLTYEWTVIERPAGADAGVPLDPDDTPSVDLYVDVAGDWMVQLVVANAFETRSEPVRCTFPASPQDAVYVELSWNTANADLDLHLVDGLAADVFDVPEDCNFCNPNPDWGASGPAGDPRLDIDDLAGFGPENINIFDPAPGLYQVKVHYFRRNGNDAVNARIRVWLDGVEQTFAPDTRQMLHDEIWDVGFIDMAYRTWSPSATANRDNPVPPECPSP